MRNRWFSENLNVRYARAYLKLAKMDLKKTLQINKHVSGTFPDTVVEPLRQVVRTAEAQLEQALAQLDHALNGNGVSRRNIDLHDAEAAVMVAETRLRQATAASQRMPDSFDESELERLSLTAEVAQLALAKARAASVQSAVDHLQSELADLRKEVLQLHGRLAEVSTRV